MIKQNQKYINKMMAFMDAISILLSFMLAWYIRFSSGFITSDSHLTLRQYAAPFIFIVPLYLILYNIFNLYSTYRGKSVFDEFMNILKSNIVGIFIFVLALYLTKQMHYSRYFLFIFAMGCTFITAFFRGIVRYILRSFRKNGYNLKHILLIGLSDLSVEFLRMINENKQWGYNVIGIIDDNKRSGYTVEGCEVIGKIRDLENIFEDFEIDEVYITLELKEYEKLGKIIAICEKSGVRTEIIPDYYKYIPARPYVEEVGGLPIINLRYIPLDNIINKITKRVFDIIVSLMCIIISSPVMLVTAVIIKLTSPGPVIFKQERVGLNKKIFTMYKFRSMKMQNEKDENTIWTTKDDARKTRFGTFIRKTSIDELPQFFNVLKGDMSLVGPRPERPYFVEQFKEKIPKYMVKHQVRPGITGWAQVNGLRGDTSIRKRVEYDLYYIENWRLLFDVKIMFLTVFKGFINKNAY